jgi:hypothetical protein
MELLISATQMFFVGVVVALFITFFLAMTFPRFLNDVRELGETLAARISGKMEEDECDPLVMQAFEKSRTILLKDIVESTSPNELIALRHEIEYFFNEFVDNVPRAKLVKYCKDMHAAIDRMEMIVNQPKKQYS